MIVTMMMMRMRLTSHLPQSSSARHSCIPNAGVKQAVARVTMAIPRNIIVLRSWMPAT